MSTLMTPTSASLLQPCSLSRSFPAPTAGMSAMGALWRCLTYTPNYRKSSGYRQPSGSLLQRNQWLLQHATTGQFLQAIAGRELVWTDHPGLAHCWLTTFAIAKVIKSDPDLFGDASLLQAVARTYVAHPQAPHHWICNA